MLLIMSINGENDYCVTNKTKTSVIYKSVNNLMQLFQ